MCVCIDMIKHMLWMSYEYLEGGRAYKKTIIPVVGLGGSFLLPQSSFERGRLPVGSIRKL